MSSLNLTPLSINTPQAKQGNFFDRLGTGLIDTFGGAGSSDINAALSEKNPVQAGLKLTSGFAKSAYSAATFIPKGIFNTTKDFATEVFKPGQSNLSKNIDAALNTDSGQGNFAQGNNLANAFLAGLGETMPFLALLGMVNETPANTNQIRGVNKLNSKLGQVKENFLNKDAASINQKLGLEKNTKTAVNQRLKAAKTGSKTPGQIMAENRIALDENAVSTIDEHIAVREATKQALLQSEGKYGNLDQAAVQAKANLKLSGSDKIQAQKIIDRELAAYKAQFRSQGQNVEGKLMLPADQFDKVKSGLYRQSYGRGLTTSDTITKTAQKTFAREIMKDIENLSDNKFIHELNRQEGDFINAKSFLEGKDLSKLGKTSTYTRLTRKVAGAVIGSPGGPLGSAIGAEVADYVGEILNNQQIPASVRNLIIRNLQDTPIGETIIQKAQAVIKQRLQEQINRPQLEEKKTIFAGPRTQTETSIQVQEAGRATTRNPKSGQMQRQYLSSPKNNPEAGFIDLTEIGKSINAKVAELQNTWNRIQQAKLNATDLASIANYEKAQKLIEKQIYNMHRYTKGPDGKFTGSSSK